LAWPKLKSRIVRQIYPKAKKYLKLLNILIKYTNNCLKILSYQVNYRKKIILIRWDKRLELKENNKHQNQIDDFRVYRSEQLFVWFGSEIK